MTVVRDGNPVLRGGGFTSVVSLLTVSACDYHMAIG